MQARTLLHYMHFPSFIVLFIFIPFAKKFIYLKRLLQCASSVLLVLPTDFGHVMSSVPNFIYLYLVLSIIWQCIDRNLAVVWGTCDDSHSMEKQFVLY